MRNLCFGKCGVLHCNLWGTQTIIHNTECSNAAEINYTFEHSVLCIWFIQPKDCNDKTPHFTKPSTQHGTLEAAEINCTFEYLVLCVWEIYGLYSPKTTMLKHHIVQSINFLHTQHGMLEAAAINTWSQCEW